MRILLVLAHPLADSFAAAVAQTVRNTLEENGHEVDLLDLYREGFDPRLSAHERAAYMTDSCVAEDVAREVARLKAADGLVLVFPQWWFNFPAILKGFFDRAFAPGVAFHHDPAGGRIRPALTNIRLFWAFTSTGSPWWVVHLYMGNPVRRILRRGIAAFCAKGLDFRMFNIYDMDRSTDSRRKTYLDKVRRAAATIR
jgi:putative NADPH-quinone reductase